MRNVLDRIWIGAQCRTRDFWEDFRKEERGAAEIVAVILLIVIVIAVATVFRKELQDLVGNVFKDLTNFRNDSAI